jgi:hypothetical protein
VSIAQVKLTKRNACRRRDRSEERGDREKRGGEQEAGGRGEQSPPTFHVLFGS